MSKKDWETDGTRNGQKVFCPVNAYTDCPYCDKEGVCHIADPIEDCDDFAAMWESWEDWDDADNVDPDAPEDFADAEIDWAMSEYGYDPYLGCYTDDC